MSAETATRGWFQLRLATCMMLMLAAGGLIYLNLVSYQAGPIGDMERVELRKGVPFAYTTMLLGVSFEGPDGARLFLRSATNFWLPINCWILALDILANICVLALTGFLSERLQRHSK